MEQMVVECGFYRSGVLVGTGLGLTYNVESGQKGFVDVFIQNARDADSTECRVRPE